MQYMYAISSLIGLLLQFYFFSSNLQNESTAFIFGQFKQARRRIWLAYFI